MSRHMAGQRAVRQRPAEFEKDLDSGLKQRELRMKHAAGDATVNRWRDEIYIERAEKLRKKGKGNHESNT